MLEGSESPKSLHKLVLPENVSIRAFYTIILSEMDPKEAKLVNLAKKQVYKSISAEVRDPKNGCGHIFFKSTIAQPITNVSSNTNLQLQASLEYILMKNLKENF